MAGHRDNYPTNICTNYQPIHPTNIYHQQHWSPIQTKTDLQLLMTTQYEPEQIASTQITTSSLSSLIVEANFF